MPLLRGKGISFPVTSVVNNMFLLAINVGAARVDNCHT